MCVKHKNKDQEKAAQARAGTKSAPLPCAIRSQTEAPASQVRIKNDPRFDPNALRIGAKLFHDRVLGKHFASKKAALALAEHVWGIAFSGGFPVEWVEGAIDNVAGEVLASELAGEPLARKAVYQTIIRFSKAPRRPRTMADEAGNESELEHRARADEERAAFRRQRVETEERESVRPVQVAELARGVLERINLVDLKVGT